jgi:hypothetical protein
MVQAECVRREELEGALLFDFIQRYSFSRAALHAPDRAFGALYQQPLPEVAMLDT